MSRTYLKEMNWQHFIRHATALGRFADFFAKGSASDPAATIVRSPTVMFLPQGMGLWFGTAHLNAAR
jgi:hypothetical protein